MTNFCFDQDDEIPNILLIINYKISINKKIIFSISKFLSIAKLKKLKLLPVRSDLKIPYLDIL